MIQAYSTRKKAHKWKPLYMFAVQDCEFPSRKPDDRELLLRLHVADTGLTDAGGRGD